MKNLIFLILCSIIFLSSCREARIKEHNEWGSFFQKKGISKGCFMLKDQTHESIHYYNKAQCITPYLPASTFKIFNSLVALETAVAKDDGRIIKWDGKSRSRPEWNKDMDMREAFKTSCLPYYQTLAREIGKANFEHYLDTMNYGNKKISDSIDQFWLNNTLKISADEQLGFLKKLYFNELPLSERSQRIVKSLMLQEDSDSTKLYYKTGFGTNESGESVIWIVGLFEKIIAVKEHKESMNKSDSRTYPYFFALNFLTKDTQQDWLKIRVELLHELLDDYLKNNGL